MRHIHVRHCGAYRYVLCKPELGNNVPHERRRTGEQVT